MKVLNKFMLTVLLLLWTAFVTAETTINDYKYTPYIGDFNGDGEDDFYFNEIPLFVLIHGDISIPLRIFGKVGFILYSTESGFSEPEYANFENVLESMLLSGAVRVAVTGTDFLAWSNPGEASHNILIRGVDQWSSSAILTFFSGDTSPILMDLIEADANVNLGDKSVELSLDDLNNDGKQDVLIGGYAYLSDFTGLPVATPIVIISPSLITEKFIYDDLGRLVRVEVSDGESMDYLLDSEDNRSVTSKLKGLAN